MKVRFIVLLLFGIFGAACTSNKNHPVPSVPFDIAIDISLPAYDDLIGVRGFAFVNGGSRGIIVYRRGIDDFVAFDRHSPADPAGNCANPLTPNSDNFLLLDDICNDAQFSLYDGSPISDSEFGLRQYQVAWDGNTAIRIFN